MIVYRLTKREYLNDLSGRGAEINGGRWNNKELPALYTTSSRALAALEVAVHIPLGIMPKDYFMITIEIPDDAGILKLNVKDLPAKWNRSPISRVSQDIGDEFLKANQYLVLQAPSVSVQGDYNYVINPRHPAFSAVKIVITEPFEFDSRLFRH